MARHRKPPSRSSAAAAAGTKKNVRQTRWTVLALGCTCGVALLVATLLWQSSSAHVFTIDMSAQEPRLPPGEQDTATVHVISDFLPLHLAARWTAAAGRAWAESNRWVYTSNNNGSRGGPSRNAKVRGNHDIAGRRATAHELRRRGMFAYSKWELLPDDNLTVEIQNALDSSAIRARVEALVGATDVQGVSDVFVTRYTTGDFLSSHNDGFSGTWAFIVGLTDGPTWRPAFGGDLRFLCPGIKPDVESFHGRRTAAAADGVWCSHVAPAWNTAVLFRTRPKGPMHEVAPLHDTADAEGFGRYAVTGWYNEAQDIFSADSQLERERMRGAQRAPER
jgi:hypothetical protein